MINTHDPTKPTDGATFTLQRCGAKSWVSKMSSEGPVRAFQASPTAQSDHVTSRTPAETVLDTISTLPDGEIFTVQYVAVKYGFRKFQQGVQPGPSTRSRTPSETDSGTINTRTTFKFFTHRHSSRRSFAARSVCLHASMYRPRHGHPMRFVVIFTVGLKVNFSDCMS